MVRQVTTYYCEGCDAAYSSLAEAEQCEHSSRPVALAEGSVVLWGESSAEGFDPATGHLHWSKVTAVRTEQGREGAPGHAHFYTVEQNQEEIAEADLEPLSPHGLSWQRGLLQGPEPSRSLTVLMETYDDVRAQMADCFRLLSSLAGIQELTPEDYAKWDDLRYTAYDFGFIQGDFPIALPGEIQELLHWCAEPVPAHSLYERLFSKPALGLHGGEQIHAPFDDNVGVRTKWLVGRGDPYKYLRFHMQPQHRQVKELEGLLEGNTEGREVWLDDIELVYQTRKKFAPTPEKVVQWARKQGHGELAEGLFAGHEENQGTSVQDLATELFRWICAGQERWNKTVDVTSTIIPHQVPVIAVAAGKGGVGKSTIAAELARSFVTQGRHPLLLDLDFYGPSAPVEFELEGQYLSVEGGYIQPQLKDGVRVVSLGNMIGSDAALQWRGPVLEAFIHLLTAHISYNDVDCIILDCPPGTGDVQLGIMNRIRPHVTILVTTASNLALADVTRALTSFREAGVSVTGVIENMSHIAFNHGQSKRLFGSHERVQNFCSHQGLDLLGELPFADTRGELTAHMDKIAERLLLELKER